MNLRGRSHRSGRALLFPPVPPYTSHKRSITTATSRTGSRAREGWFMGKALPAETVAEIRRLAGEGLGRNEVARRAGVSAAAVTRYAPEGSFDRTTSAAAVKARQVDMAERRARLASDLLDEVARLLADMRTGHLAFGWYGKDGDYRERNLDEPPPADKRALAGAASSLISQHLRLVDHDSDGGVAHAESVLDQFMDAVAQRARELRE